MDRKQPLPSQSSPSPQSSAEPVILQHPPQAPVPQQDPDPDPKEAATSRSLVHAALHDLLDVRQLADITPARVQIWQAAVRQVLDGESGRKRAGTMVGGTGSRA